MGRDPFHGREAPCAHTHSDGTGAPAQTALLAAVALPSAAETDAFSTALLLGGLTEQEHIAGPALFGKLGLGGRQVLKYNAALLFKLSSAAAERTFRAQLEYEF